MSIQSRRPVRMLGGSHNSGHIYTGHVTIQRGGNEVAMCYSGAIAAGLAACPTGSLTYGGSVLIASGRGRVTAFNALFPAGVAIAGNGEGAVLSGPPIVIYDTAITARSGIFTDGTISESGRKILFTWYPPRLLSGATPVGGGFNPIPLDIPYTSGLCVMHLSGGVGWNVQFTREYDPADEPRGP